MRSTFYGLEIGKTGLFIAQNQMDLTGHNISNVDTEGFTRQRLDTASLPPAAGDSFIATDTKGTAGRGVETVLIEQVRNPFLDYQYRKENATTTKWQTKEQYFEYVESLFNNELEDMELSSGISAIFSSFYDALYELQQSPEDLEIRVNLQQNAITMGETLNYYYERLVEQQDNLNECVRITVEEINSLAKEIAFLNDQIFGYELSGARANDLRDQRNLLIDELSGLINITAYEDANGHMIIQVGEKNLLRHTTTNTMLAVADIPNELNDGETMLNRICWADRDGEATFNDVNVSDGAMKAYFEIRDGNASDQIGIPYIIDKLNELAQKIAADINDIHETGYTIPNEAGAESRTGVQFFYEEYDANGNSLVTARNFRLSDDILNDVYNIAASDMPVSIDGEDNEQKGNGRIALAMCELITKKNEDGNPDNFDSLYKSILNDISVEMDYIHDTYKSQDVMKSHIESQRQSVSDVSLDEEMTNIVRFGHAYNAASRVITAMDEELDVIINKMGLVGRS